MTDERESIEDEMKANVLSTLKDAMAKLKVGFDEGPGGSVTISNAEATVLYRIVDEHILNGTKP